MTTATQQLLEQRERDMTERALHHAMHWFCKKYTPADKLEAADFHADLTLVIQAVHRDASRETHALLTKALMAMPNPFPVTQGALKP
jgi:hypothetical protein